MTTKRILLLLLGVPLLLGVVLQFAPRSARRYRAESMVIAEPYTNVFLGRQFESHVVQTIPGVLALRVTPIFSAIPGSGVPVLTNGVGIHIIAVGSTPEEAQRVANEAAVRLCRTGFTNYGVRGELADRASSARRYSYFHDSFQPAIGRLFRH